MSKYKASLSRSKGRGYWSIIFRHPVKKDSKDKYGLRVRRGLGTDDQEQAEILVKQMNEILEDEKMWSNAAKEIAIARNYSDIIIRAFYDDLEMVSIDYREIRNTLIAIPDALDWRKVLLVGATGVGKTTFLRQLMGTYSKNDRFPTTAAGRTTTCDMEVICSEQEKYEAAITFLTRNEIRFYVEENVQSTISSILFDSNKKDITQTFVIHKDQRFRMNYVLGDIEVSEDDSNDDFDLFDDELNADDTLDNEEIVQSDDRLKMAENLTSYISRIQALSLLAKEATIKEFELEEKELSNADKQAVVELIIEEYLDQSTEFHEIVDDIMDDIQSRFGQLENILDCKITKDTTGWITSFYFSTSDRKEFLTQARKFSSNHKEQWGSLLTPLVEGIRIKGPFKPDGYTEVPKLVIYDGEGIGHSSDSVTSLPTKITRLYQEVHAILLVDKGGQPMLGPSQAVLRSLLASGHVRKLLLCFTHMDSVNGDNLIKGIDKVNHVKASIGTALSSLIDNYGIGLITPLEQTLKENSFFFFKMQEKMQKGTTNQLTNLIDAIDSIKEQEENELSDIKLQYHVINLSVSIQNALKKFHEKWEAILGFKYLSGVNQEHWTRVRALSKRLGLLNNQNHYDTLRPIADFISTLQEHLALFILNPKNRDASDDSDRQVVTDKISQEVFSNLHDVATEILLDNQKQSWKSAYNCHGRGSARERARQIKAIYQKAAPILGEVPSDAVDEFAFQDMMTSMIEEVINKYNGEIISHAVSKV